jgi:hypothetical protein
MTSGPAFQVDLNFNVIQSLRLLHALLESHGDVRVDPHTLPKLSRLREVFGVQVSDEVEGVPVLPGLEIDHEGEPKTRIGTIARPLILAHGLVQKCRSLWDEERTLKACFAGRLHQERRRVLREWTERQFPERDVDLPSQAAVDRRVQLRETVHDYAGRILRGPLRPLQKYVKVPPIDRRTTIQNVVLTTSDRGWRHPTKAWDGSYFRLLGNSKFVLCPDGKFVWTYRFFEAALCGAIPIVQNQCPLYEGFRYYTMDDSLEELKWSGEDALHNYRKCRKRLTVSRGCLNDEVDRLHRHASRSG